MTTELAGILDELQIRAISVHGYRGPMETMAVDSMERILRQHGYAHLKMVLMSIVETPNNKRELVGPVIWAVSDVIRAHPTWPERAGEWFRAIDCISLGEMRLRAKANRKAARMRGAIATMLFQHLKPIFEPERQGRLI